MKNLTFNILIVDSNNIEHKLPVNGLFDKLVSEYKIPINILLELFLKELLNEQNILKNIDKPKLSFPRLPEFDNLQELSQKQYFDNIRKIINYFFEKIPTNRIIIDNSRNLKQIELLVNKDKANINEIIEVIDFIASDEELKKTIKHPYLLRKNYKSLKTRVKQ